LLSVALGLFLADAGVSLLDDTLILCFGIHTLAVIRGIMSFLAIMASMLIYLLSGATPMIPKRFAFPIALFIPVAMLALIPLLTYHYSRLQQIAWVTSFCQVIFGLCILFWAQGAFRFRWPFVPETKLGHRMFDWLNLSGFVLINVFVLLPGVLLYLVFCASLAVDHFSGSFVALRSDGLMVRARTYVRDDGKTIQLIPMMHIGDAGFYNQISKSFPTNSVILLEGVTDNRNLLKHELSYKRMAKSLGLTEQKEEFVPVQGQPRRADVDVEEFSKSSIEFLNLAALIHSRGLRSDVFLELIQKSQDPLLTEQLWEDLLTLRNAHLLKEIKAELLHSNRIVVPWGAGHMRGIAVEIQKSGFHLSDTREYKVINFPSIGNRRLHSNKK
jgi:hypothetical protein